MNTEEARQAVTDMMVTFISDFNTISRSEALQLYQESCKEMREKREREEQARMTMEYGP